MRVTRRLSTATHPAEALSSRVPEQSASTSGWCAARTRGCLRSAVSRRSSQFIKRGRHLHRHEPDAHPSRGVSDAVLSCRRPKS